jgi:hypothetical protein
MGFLNNNTLTVEAILTKKGRELLAAGGGLNITQFAVADDEVDYSLYAPTHPLGTAYYGSIIEGMPLLEAVPDETQVMRYKLVTLPRGTSQIPIISIGMPSITIQYGQNSSGVTITPSTSQAGLAVTLNSTLGYSAILFDSNAATLVGNGVASGVSPRFFGDAISANAAVAVGKTFTIIPKAVTTITNTKITIIGNETGGTITIPVTVNP